MSGPLVGGNTPRPFVSSGKAYRVTYYREANGELLVVPGEVFGTYRVHGLDVPLVLARAVVELDELAEGEPGVTFVGVDGSGEVVHRAYVPAADARPFPAQPLAEGEDCGRQRHAGPLNNTERYNDAGGIWAGYGECAVCGSTVKGSAIVGRESAAKAA